MWMGTEMVDPELLQTNPAGKKKKQKPHITTYTSWKGYLQIVI